MSVADAVMAPAFAVIVVLPAPAPFANPEPLTPATDGWVEAQVTTLLRSCMLPSLKVPMAANCWVVPAAMLAVAGDMAIETSTGELTVSTAEPWTVPEVAVILADPMPTPAARPPEPIVATGAALEDQVADAVKSCVLPSE